MSQLQERSTPFGLIITKNQLHYSNTSKSNFPMKILNLSKTIGTIVRKGALLVLVLLLGITSSNFAQTVSGGSECTMVCSGDLIVPVDRYTCESTISYKNLLPNPCYDDGYIIQVLTLNNHLVAEGNGSVTVSVVGQYIYKVIHEIDGKDVACWGYIKFEDKNGPVKYLQYDSEGITLVCGVPSVDPSGIDDLATEYVSCVVPESYGTEALEPWFDVLENSDFKDCTGVDDVHFFTEVYDICKDDLPGDVEKAAFDNPPVGWEPCYVYKRSWFASDVTGRLSDTCAQFVVVVRPEAHKIKIDEYVEAECGEDEAEVMAEGYPYFRDLINTASDILTCPSSSNKKVRISPDSHYCKYAASVHYSEKVPLCNTDGSKVFKLIGKWTIMDWCASEIVWGNDGKHLFDDYKTTLKIVDETKPVAVGRPDYTTETSLFDCTGSVVVGPQQFTDCVGIESVETIAEYTIAGEGPHDSRFERITSPTNGITLNDVPLNVFIQVTFIATDFCGNYRKVYRGVFVNDDRAPVCIANDELNVSMVRVDEEDPTKLGARVYGEDLDDTSRDNCFPLILEVRRADEAAVSSNPESLWAEYVEFTEKDLDRDGCRGEVKVELRVTEDRGEFIVPAGEIDYYPQALSSTCWSTVILEDKNQLILELGDDKVVSCLEYFPEFDELKIIGCYDGVETSIDTLFESECDYYEKLRVEKVWTPFRNHDGSKIYKRPISQEITVENVHDTKFTFPIDYKLDCSKATLPAPASIDDIIEEKGCSNWLMEVEDQEFESNDPDACSKVLRRYTFINWCTWDPSNTELAVVTRPADGVWSLDEQIVLHYRDADLDYRNDIDDLNDGDIYDIEQSELGHKHDGAWVQIDNGDRVQGQKVFNHVDDIRGNATTSLDGYKYGYFSYTQVIKIQDKEDPIAAEPKVKQSCDPLTTDCDRPTFVEITLDGADNCSDLYYQVHLQPFQSGPFITDPFGTLDGKVHSGFYPEGTHNFEITTSDACGNFVKDTIEITVRGECKRPTPVCYATFIASMEDGTVNLWASDVESGSSTDNCSDYSDLKFTIELLSDKNGDDVINGLDASPSAPAETVVTLTCENVGTALVALWVTDEAGNEQFCVAPVTVVDNGGVCINIEANVTGSIVNEEDEEIDEVTVNITSEGMNPVSKLFDGFFDFISIPMQRDLTVTAEKNHKYLNGVSTSDLVLLQRHILGVKELNSPYKLIAADANRDDKVDTRDMLHISRLILGVYDELPSNTSWRFVEKGHVFSNPTSPWGFPESSTFNNIDSDVQANFIGIKIGDLSGNASPNNLLGDDDNATLRTVSIATENLDLVAGQSTDIVFSADQLKEVSGYQFTIALSEGTVFNGLSLGAESKLTEANFGLTKLDDNLITVSWSSVDAISFESSTTLFALNVTTLEATTVQNAVSLNSAFTPAEAYDNNVDKLNISLNILSESDEFELFQNFPNPVNNETVIGFNLPNAGSASLKIMDVSGKVLRIVQGDYSQGYNQITLDRSQLGAAGVLYYQLDTRDNSASRKMIIID